jgi:diguanylate cyclase (GGDEF)-like protein
VAGPLGLPVLSALVFGLMIRGPWTPVKVFPLFGLVIVIEYVTAGLVWASAATATASLLALLGFFFAPQPHHRFLFLVDAGFFAVTLYFLARFEHRRESADNRARESLDCLEMELSTQSADIDAAQRAIADGQARVTAYSRLQMFTDDLIGPYHREELLGRAREGLSAMFPRAEAEVHLFPGPDAPDPGDAWGRRIQKLDQPRLFPSKDDPVPTWGPGTFMALPLRGRESRVGWISLETDAAPFHVQDLRLAAIATDLVSLALSNTDRYSQTEALAISDELTGVYTRGYFDERLQEEFAKARHKGRPFTLVIIDIDHFKRVNDQHGHHVGDEVLKWLAQFVLGQARDTDFVARYGGEEFVILMPNTTGADALRFTQRLNRAIARTPFRWGNKQVRLTLSAGVAALTEDVPDEEDLVRRADAALYTAKNTGRNKVCAYDG